MSYFSYKCLYVFTSLFVRVFLQNYQGVSWNEDTSTIQNCSCAWNDAQGPIKNVYFMNRTQTFVDISTFTLNGTNNYSNSNCICCKWEIHVEYDKPLDVVTISSDSLQDKDCGKYSLMITNCQGGIIFNFNSSNVNKISYIDMATKETSICIYFNSSQSGSGCNYIGLFPIEFDYISKNNCGCLQSNELHLNAINASLDFPEYGIFCLNVPCKWHINISYDDPTAFTIIKYTQDFQSCNSRLIMTNCKNNVPIIDSSSSAEININELEYNDRYENTFEIQENELCITLNTTGSEIACNYYPTNGNFCWFQFTLRYNPSPYVIIQVMLRKMLNLIQGRSQTSKNKEEGSMQRKGVDAP
jgi:hypothetical protein